MLAPKYSSCLARRVRKVIVLFLICEHLLRNVFNVDGKSIKSVIISLIPGFSVHSILMISQAAFYLFFSQFIRFCSLFCTVWICDVGKYTFFGLQMCMMTFLDRLKGHCSIKACLSYIMYTHAQKYI